MLLWNPAIGKKIETILHQEVFSKEKNNAEEKPNLQTLRMAALIITDAFVFQSSLAGKTEMESVRSLRQLLPIIDYADVIKDWHTILKVNYRPIFEDALKLVEALATDDRLVRPILMLLCEAARDLIETGIAQIHELAGIVFQKLITDRKYVKANYTLPESAVLLSTLVLSKLPKGKLPKVADFACGTGALLNGVYQRILSLYEQSGGNGRGIHQRMLEENIIGVDIMPNATHLTAAALASIHADIKIGDTQIVTAPYGFVEDGGYAVGSLELLNDISLLDTEAKQIGGEEDRVVKLQQALQHGDFDIVIQNPPFTRPGSDSNTSVPKSTFQGSDRPEDEQRAMQVALHSKNTKVADGASGFASYFIDLADKKLKRGGTMGFILPLTVLGSPMTQKLRDMWATEYHNVAVITMAQAKGLDIAFSADTTMAECMVVATKGKKTNNTGRGKFISLNHRPRSVLEALEVVNNTYRLDSIRRLEDEPSGGDPLKVGDEILGHVLNCPLLTNRAWEAVRIKEMALIQSAYRLAAGEMWLPEQVSPLEIPVCLVGDIAEVNTTHRDIHDKGERGAFDVEKTYTNTDLYPGLWHVNAPAQRAMMVEPDCHLIMRPNRHDKAQTILARNGRVHFNVDMGFSANSLGVLFTEKPAVGISSLPNVVLKKQVYDYVWTLWGNSTLGLLLHWAHSGKQQPGRGRGSRTSLLQMPTLDVRCLPDEVLANAECIFHDLKHQRMLPFNEVDRDPVRHELDRLLLTEVLGITNEDAYNAIHRLRELLSAEPSIHGGKKSKCNLDSELARLKQKGIAFPSWYVEK